MQGYDVQQSSTAYPLVFLMVLSSDHISPATGLTPTVTISKNGGAFASPAGAVTEIGSGWYQVAGNATDTGTLGPLLLHATAATADPTDACYPVVAYAPHDAVHLGLSAIPNAAPSASGGLITVGTGAGQLNPTSGGVDVQTIKTQSITCAAGVTIYPAIGSAHELTVDSSGRVDVGSFLGHAVTLDSNNLPAVNTVDFAGAAADALVSGQVQAQVASYASGQAPPTTAQIAAAILASPANLIATDSSGRIIVQPSGLDAIAIESGVNLPQAISIIAAACAGESSGVNAGSPVYQAINNPATTRISATASNGDRSSVTLTLPSI